MDKHGLDLGIGSHMLKAFEYTVVKPKVPNCFQHPHTSPCSVRAKNANVHSDNMLRKTVSHSNSTFKML